MLARLRARGGALLSAHSPAAIFGAALHLITLTGAFVLLLRMSRGQWFFQDEWEFLVERGVGDSPIGLFEPHVEHWTTVPILVYRGLYSVFAVRSYTPYVLTLLVTHLFAVHLLWRLLRRCGVEPVLASALTAVFAILGAGSENLLWAFQITFIGSIAFGLLQLLLVSEPGPFGPRDIGGWVAAVVALMCSTIGVTMVVIAGMTALFRRGTKVALLTVGVPACVYLAWLVTVGKEGLGSHPRNLDTLLEVPSYLWIGLSNGLERIIGFPGAGPVLVLALGTWLLFRTHLRRTRASVAVAMALGALFLYVIIGSGRSFSGLEQAKSSRYVYIVAALLFPAVGLLLTEAVGRVASRRVVVLGMIGLVLLHNVGQLRKDAHAEAAREQGIKHQLLAAVKLGSSGAQLVSALPEPRFSPNLTLPLLLRLAREGKLPRQEHHEEADRLAAITALQVALTDTPLIHGGPPGPPAILGTARATVKTLGKDCHAISPSGLDAQVAISTSVPRSMLIRSTAAGSLGVSLSVGGADAPVGPVRSFTLPANAAHWLNVSRSPAWLFLRLPDGDVELCAGPRPA